MSYERSRKNLAIIFRGLSSIGQSNAAKCLEISEGSVSKMKAEKSELSITFPKIANLLAEMRFKVVPEDYKCVDPETFRILHKGHQMWAQSIKDADQLLFEDPE